MLAQTITSGESNLTTGRIAAAHRRYSLFFTMGRPSPSKLPRSMAESGPHLIHGSLGPPESSTQIAF